MAFDYPVFLALEGVPVLVVGGGRVAERKVAGLVTAGARVTVVAPRVADAVAVQASEVRAREFAPGDLAGQRLVIAATDDPAVNAAVAAGATAVGIWVNSADDPANCTFALPAVTRRGPVVVAVGTGGASPALASHLRDRIATEVLDERVERAVVELARQRREIQAGGGSTEDIDWAPRIAAALHDVATGEASPAIRP